MMKNYKIIKIFNNNVVLALHDGIEKVLIRKGIGYSRRPGEIVDGNTKLERVFIIENPETSSMFNQLITRVDRELIGLCEEIFHFISTKTGGAFTAEKHLRLLDHIAFTVERLKKKDEIINPFLVEIETLYSKEIEIA